VEEEKFGESATSMNHKKEKTFSTEVFFAIKLFSKLLQKFLHNLAKIQIAQRKKGQLG